MRSSSSACSNVSVAGSIDENSDAVRGFSPPSVDLAHLHVGTEAPGLDLDLEPALGVGAEHAVVGRRGEDLLGPLDRHLVGRQVVGDRGPVLPALEVGPVPPDPDHDRLAVAPRRPSGIELISRASISARCDDTVAFRPERVHLGPVARHGARRVAAEVEAGQPGQRLLGPRRDVVEVVLHDAVKP